MGSILQKIDPAAPLLPPPPPPPPPPAGIVQGDAHAFYCSEVRARLFTPPLHTLFTPNYIPSHPIRTPFTPTGVQGLEFYSGTHRSSDTCVRLPPAPPPPPPRQSSASASPISV
jgi:hypothetical protein